MAPETAEVERALLALPPDERAAVVHRGLLSLDEGGDEVDQAEIDAAWRDEIRRRIDDIESGKVQLIDADDHYARLRARYATGRE
ncbi:MAG: addiction module protein [Ilumatobacteraceae bacterium]